MKKLTLTTAALLIAFAFQTYAAEPKEVKTSSGIVITTIKDGSGVSPKSSDTVKVHYRGALVDGKEFDSSYGRGQPATFPLNRVIPCWTEGVQTMKVGGKAKLLCPPNLAYGSRGVPGTIPPDSTLIFEIELLDIVK
jgi:FKBP-type peptidyl-prolyl cis-trans isomerase FkpA